MIATLEGKVSEKVGELVVIECGGIGYGAYVSFEDFGALAPGEKAKLYIYEHIRENVHDLFGFRKLETKFLSQASGVGKRVAERVVVDLKDKVGLTASEDAVDFLTAAADPSDEALQGLVALGYSVQDAAEALKDVDEKLPAADRIKQALKA
jgi:Holliday junction DNA helicase RuvA